MTLSVIAHVRTSSCFLDLEIIYLLIKRCFCIFDVIVIYFLLCCHVSERDTPSCILHTLPLRCAIYVNTMLLPNAKLGCFQRYGVWYSGIPVALWQSNTSRLILLRLRH